MDQLTHLYENSSIFANGGFVGKRFIGSPKTQAGSDRYDRASSQDNRLIDYFSHVVAQKHPLDLKP